MAKSKLQGITLEIGGDTTALSKALKKPNTEAYELQGKLKAANHSSFQQEYLKPLLPET